MSKFDLAKCKIWSLTYDKQGNTLDETHYTSAFVGVSSTNQKQVLECHLEEKNASQNIFKYNALNQQIKAITKDGNTIVNRYDSEGLRYEIEENEKLAKFVFNNNGDILVETDSEDNVVSRVIRGYEIVSADIIDETEKETDYSHSFVVVSSSIPTNFSLSRYYYSVDE